MILYVDPNTNDRNQITSALEHAGFTASGEASITDAMETLDTDSSIERLVTEYQLPDGSGLELISTTREILPDTPCILYTRTPLNEIDTGSFRDVIAEYLAKTEPDATELLMDQVSHSVEFQSQTAYPLPDSEEARLDALERYVNIPAEYAESIDRLTEIATELFRLESAAVGVIDAHHERFLSCYGATSIPWIEKKPSALIRSLMMM